MLPEFQFLIGRLITMMWLRLVMGRGRFQFLIGRLITAGGGENRRHYGFGFQFLIGRLITTKRLPFSPLLSPVSIPHR